MDRQLDTAPCGYLSLDDNGTILVLNKTLTTSLGFTKETLVGQNIDSILTAGARLYYHTHVFPLLRTRGVVEEIYLSLLTTTSEPLPVLLNGVREQVDGNTVINMALIPMRRRSQFEDELLQAKRAAEEANRTKERFLHMMSHDLQTPLTAIRMAAAMLANGLGGSVTDIQRQELGRIEEASIYVLKLVRDILTFARLSTGRINLPLENVVLADIFTRTELLVKHLVEEAGISFTQEPLLEIKVKAIAEQLQQIVLNLVTNAIKFTARGGQVMVQAKQVDRQVHLIIADTGRGITPEQLERIFEPFIQLERVADSGRAASVGLGLAISRELARAMGGDIIVESKVNQGSKFTVLLQVAD